jgi:hypothetical protein
MRQIQSFIVALGVTALVACGHKDDNSGTVVIKASSDTAPRAMAAGDVRIVAADSGVDLALLGDTISSGLSEYALAKAKKETNPTDVKGSGFAASLEKTIKSTVQTALGTRVGFPLKDIKSASYTNGRIDFEWTGPRSTIFDNTKVNKKPLLESFSAADAQRFVDAVNARKRAVSQ